jgi:hypothetical protein
VRALLLWSRRISSEKKAKCPVIFVVSTLMDKTPAIFTIPATNESTDASFRL